MGGISHTHDGTRLNDRMWIDYILTRQAHRPRVQDVEVAPQPSAPAKVDSDHNILFMKVRLSGHFALNRQIRRLTINKRLEFDRQLFIKCRERVVARVMPLLVSLVIRLAWMSFSLRLLLIRSKRGTPHVATADMDGVRNLGRIHISMDSEGGCTTIIACPPPG